jgi:hypothetical protein
MTLLGAFDGFSRIVRGPTPEGHFRPIRRLVALAIRRGESSSTQRNSRFVSREHRTKARLKCPVADSQDQSAALCAQHSGIRDHWEVGMGIIGLLVVIILVILLLRLL